MTTAVDKSPAYARLSTVALAGDLPTAPTPPGGTRPVLNADPFSGHVFLFRSKRADYLKILYWDGSGLCLFAKRLEAGRFVWPPITEGGMTLTPAQLALLLEAMDWRRTVALEPPRKPVMV